MARSVAAVALSLVISGCGPAAAPPPAASATPSDPAPGSGRPAAEAPSERGAVSPAAAAPAADTPGPEAAPNAAPAPDAPEVITTGEGAPAEAPVAETAAHDAPAENAPTAEDAPRGPTLEGTVMQLGPWIDNPDGDGKVLPLIIKVRLPGRRDVTALEGTLTIRSVEDPARVLWSGPVNEEAHGGDDGIATVFFNVPYDFEDPDVSHLARTHIGIRTQQEHGVLGPPIEVRVARIGYADGTSETF